MLYYRDSTNKIKSQHLILNIKFVSILIRNGLPTKWRIITYYITSLLNYNSSNNNCIMFSGWIKTVSWHCRFTPCKNRGCSREVLVQRKYYTKSSWWLHCGGPCVFQRSDQLNRPSPLFSIKPGSGLRLFIRDRLKRDINRKFNKNRFANKFTNNIADCYSIAFAAAVVVCPSSNVLSVPGIETTIGRVTTAHPV